MGKHSARPRFRGLALLAGALVIIFGIGLYGVLNQPPDAADVSSTKPTPRPTIQVTNPPVTPAPVLTPDPGQDITFTPTPPTNWWVSPKWTASQRPAARSTSSSAASSSAPATQSATAPSQAVTAPSTQPTTEPSAAPTTDPSPDPSPSPSDPVVVADPDPSPSPSTPVSVCVNLDPVLNICLDPQ